MDHTTHFSEDRLYRYTLWRDWAQQKGGIAMFIGLNPSTADETQDDPTVRRCINFAKSWGYGSLCMTNAFAWRDTDPKKMMAAYDPVGPQNDYWLAEMADWASIIIAAWGNGGKFLNRSDEIRRLLPMLHFLKINKATGQPSHPLYLPANLQPERWE